MLLSGSQKLLQVFSVQYRLVVVSIRAEDLWISLKMLVDYLHIVIAVDTHDLGLQLVQRVVVKLILSLRLFLLALAYHG